MGDKYYSINNVVSQLFALTISLQECNFCKLCVRNATVFRKQIFAQMLHMTIQRKLSSKTTRKKEHSRVKTLPICFALLIWSSGQRFWLQNMIKAAVPSFPISNLCFTHWFLWIVIQSMVKIIFFWVNRAKHSLFTRENIF